MSTPIDINALSDEQIDILDHTANRAAGGRFCGGGKDTEYLADIGLMEFLGKPAWCDDKFYGITREGREALREAKAQKLREKAK